MIAPWNFPLAIPLGMTAAGARDRQRRRAQARRAVARLRAGARRARCARRACPPAALALLPGEGEVGAALVARPARARRSPSPARSPVGLEILARRPPSRAPGAAPPQARHRRDGRQELRDRRRRRRPRRRRPGDRRLRVRLRRPEVLGRRRACSCTRRSPTRCSSGSPAPSTCSSSARPTSFGTDVPPVIEAERAGARRSATPRSAAATGRVASPPAARRCPATAGSARRPWSPPTCPRDSPVLREEIFGPLLAVERVRDVDAACDRVDELPFALTGGLFSPQPAHRRARRAPLARSATSTSTAPITGAMVGRQPFGGNRLSGTGTKAGGPGLPAAVRRAAGRHREHRAPRPRGLSASGLRAARTSARNSSCRRASPVSSGWKVIASTRPSRTATGWPSTSASTSTPGPCSRSTARG